MFRLAVLLVMLVSQNALAQSFLDSLAATYSDMFCEHEGFLECAEARKVECASAIEHSVERCEKLALQMYEEIETGEDAEPTGESFADCFSTTFANGMGLKEERFDSCSIPALRDHQNKLREKLRSERS
ncbi:hypothetical protein MYE70_11135 [Marinobacter alexandrii]|uniref:hypothetical protein n=1 Tax=Marinobacter alexandrii TaxID=2570351 RepID=UPI001FFFF8DB|nr:hypothetical protein [Marinobacter alexandrii]MCK2149611.1 hypothetical protein [Marinobacter alexandrii]